MTTATKRTSKDKTIRNLRIKWGFCPECGCVPEHPLNAYYHRNGQCTMHEKK